MTAPDATDDPLASLPGYALRRAANAMMAELTGLLAAAGLRVSEASVLMLAGERDDMTSSEIGRMLDIQRANMAPLISRLEAAGLVGRVPLDRKSSAIVLTDAGRVRLAEVRAITDRFEAGLMARIPAEHRAHLLPALDALWR